MTDAQPDPRTVFHRMSKRLLAPPLSNVTYRTFWVVRPMHKGVPMISSMVHQEPAVICRVDAVPGIAGPQVVR